MYTASDAENRRLLNVALFDRVYVDADGEPQFNLRPEVGFLTDTETLTKAREWDGSGIPGLNMPSVQALLSGWTQGCLGS
jgi:hypothetical protein